MNRSLLRLILMLLIPAMPVAAQRAEVREDQLKDQYGFEKLENLEWLAAHYVESDLRRATRFGRQGEQLANNLMRSDLQLDAQQTNQIVRMKQTYGLIQYRRGKYVDAQEAFEEALSFAPKSADMAGRTTAILYLQKIDSLAALGEVKDNPFKSIARDINIGAAINNSKTDVTISTELQMAKIAEKRGDTTTAISHYQRAANLLRNSRDIEQAQLVESKIATFQQMRGFQVATRLPVTDTVQRISLPPTLFVREDTTNRAKDAATPILPDIIEPNRRSNYYEAYLSLQTKAQDDSLFQVMLIDRARIEMQQLQQENEIADLNIAAILLEKQAETAQKQALMIIAGGIIVGTIGILFLYITKRRKHKKLTAAYHELDVAKQELERAEQRISKMLEQQVSPEIATALLDDQAERKRHLVTIMFLDIRDFTPMASAMEPDELIDFQNAIFGFMIDIINDCHGNINQFMGDGFMATFGAPKSHGNDAANALSAANKILEKLDEVNATGKIPWTNVGIGLHTGEVVTGNVGTDHRKQFSVTGETVIIAARVEQLNKQFKSRLILTQEVAKLQVEDLSQDFNSQEVIVKGRKDPVRIMILKETVANQGVEQTEA